MKRIVHVCLVGGVSDGLTYQDNLLPKYHRRLGCDVVIITHHRVLDGKGQETRDERTDYINDDGVRVVRLEASSRLKGLARRTFPRYPALPKTLRILEPDILFIHGCQFVDIRSIVEYIKGRPKLRVYVDNHADFSNSATNWLSKNILHRIIWRHYAQKIEKHVTKFYGVLPARVDFLINMYGLPRNKVELLVMGADDDEVKRAAKPEVRDAVRAKYGIADDDFLIVTGGKIDMAKRQTLLLMEAVHQIANEKVKLILFGSIIPELKADVQVLVDGKRIQYAGWLNESESYDYFASADLVVFPGRHSVYWEQVAGQGIPMVVKWWAGTTHVDLGGNVGYLYEDSEQEIQRVLCGILDDSERLAKMRDIATDKGMKVFSYRAIARRSLEEL